MQDQHVDGARGDEVREDAFQDPHAQQQIPPAQAGEEAPILSEANRQMHWVLRSITDQYRKQHAADLDKVETRAAARYDRALAAQDQRQVDLEETMRTRSGNASGTHDQGSSRMKLKNVQPAHFYGRGVDSAAVWLKRFDTWCRVGGDMTDDHKLQNFAVLMRGNAESWLNHISEDVREDYPLLREAFLEWFDDQHHMDQVELLMDDRKMLLTDDMDEYVGEMMMGAQQCNMEDKALRKVMLKGFPKCMRADLMVLKLNNLPEFLREAKLSFSAQRVRHDHAPVGSRTTTSDLAILLGKQNLGSDEDAGHQVNNLTAVESRGTMNPVATPRHAPAGRQYRQEYASGPASAQDESYNGRSGFRTDCAPTAPQPSYTPGEYAKPTGTGRNSPRRDTPRAITQGDPVLHPTGRYLGGGVPHDAYEREQSDLDYAYDQERGLCFYCHRAGHRWYTCGPYEEDWPEEFAHMKENTGRAYPPVHFDTPLPTHVQRRPGSPRQATNRSQNTPQASQPPSYRSVAPNPRVTRGNGSRPTGRGRPTNGGPKTTSPRWNNFPAGGGQ